MASQWIHTPLRAFGGPLCTLHNRVNRVSFPVTVNTEAREP